MVRSLAAVVLLAMATVAFAQKSGGILNAPTTKIRRARPCMKKVRTS